LLFTPPSSLYSLPIPHLSVFKKVFGKILENFVGRGIPAPNPKESNEPCLTEQEEHATIKTLVQ
jgi:hypothetical protein